MGFFKNKKNKEHNTRKKFDYSISTFPMPEAYMPKDTDNNTDNK
jgi:hypothetical protein